MKAVQYMTATSAEQAVQTATDGRARFLGGGIDLLGELKEYLVETDTLINIKALPGLREMTWAADRVTFGTNVTVHQLATDPQVIARLPGLAQAAGEVGSLQIRMVATLGGNLAQHSRCWYYRHRDVHCLKKGGAMCHARDGENKFHSLFSGNPCISPVVSNLAIILTALQAVAVVRRGKEEIRLTMSQLYEKAWDNPTAHHSLSTSDLIVRVEVPLTATASAYLQVSEKSDFDWALVSCAATAQLEAGKVKSARLVLGAVAPVPFQVSAVNEFLVGKSLDAATVQAAAERMLQEAKPREHNGYKVPLAQALVRRTLLKLVG
jgi:xanthine dehydrogenase YagS FAD-binding subunit